MPHRLRAAHLALLLVVLTATLAVPTGLIGGVDAQQTPTTTDTPPVEQTTILVQLQSDGDARWTVTTTFGVVDERDRESFNTTAERFVDGETETLGFSAFERASTDASEATGRSMELTNVERTSDRTNASLSLSFTWTNFARSEGETRHVDDVYNTSDPWLTGLESDQTLILKLPPGAGIRSGPPKEVLNGQIVWEGPTTFERSELELVYNPGAGQPPDSPNTSEPGPGENPDGDGPPLLWAGLVVVSVIVAASGVYILLLRDREGFGGDAPVAETGSDGDEPPTAAATSEQTEPEEEIDEELLSDEERVELLLERNGGRMKQANIVKETGWSNAKVSQLLSSMEEEGQIDKLRIGRENLISFPDEDVTDIEN